ncbi:MAG: copper ion binding protein, partial [Desulfobia sp.]
MMQTEDSGNRKKQVRIRGMHCAACSSRIERVLAGEPGIKKAEVNFAAENMEVEWNPDLIDLDRIADMVKDLGFELVKPREEMDLQLEVKGMTCASCAARVERMAGGMAGVLSAEVNLAAESALVRYDPEQVSP